MPDYNAVLAFALLASHLYAKPKVSLGTVPTFAQITKMINGCAAQRSRRCAHISPPNWAEHSRYLPDVGRVGGKWAECSDESSSMTGNRHEASDTKAFLGSVPHLSRKLPGNGWKSVVRLSAENFLFSRNEEGKWKSCRTSSPSPLLLG
jgi:hypothetical protein